MNITFLKLGGSLITDKSKPYTARPENIQLVVSEIKKALTAKPDLKLILGHGAGSFAHQSAKKYNTINGIHSQKDAFGAAVVRYDVMQLNTMIIKECIEQELPIFSLQPSAFILASGKKPQTVHTESLIQLLKNNMIPCVFGDVILDTKIGTTIFSTDTIFPILISAFHGQNITVDHIIHAGDYDGVLDKKGNVITEITPALFENMKTEVGGSDSVDVTGGMLKKVNESISLAKHKITSIILRGNISGNISQVLISGAHTGTTIHE